MDLHNFLTGLSKSFGLFYFIAFSIGVLIYAYWPGNKKGFDQAARTVTEKDDRPWL